MINSLSDLNFISKTFKTKKILVVGDVMLDEFHWCDVERISPEAPVPVCKVNETTLALGGAANVAYNLVSLGAEVSLAGFIGTDSSADKFLNLLTSNKINSKCIIQTPYSTLLKSRIIARNQHVVRVDRENNRAIENKYKQTLLKKIKTIIKNLDAIIISDYLKGMLDYAFTQELISLGNQHSCAIITDPKGVDYTKYKNATVITPNFKEFCQATLKQHKTEEAIYESGKKLLTELNLDCLLVTRSEKGMSIIQKDSYETISTKAKEVFDITGAGDTVIATLSLCLLCGLNYNLASVVANYAAGIVVGKLGTAIVNADELISAIKNDHV